MDRAVCTIIAKNYVAYARTLAQSFLSHHPNYKVYVLIVDDFDGYISPQDECFEIIGLSELGIRDASRLCFKYDLKELCTAVKARLLEYLLQKKKVDRLLYLDPDILVTNSLEQLYEELGTFDILLTPHLDASFPDDQLLPDDGYILRAGQFNLGFIGLNSTDNALQFLGWWKPKLDENCVVDLLNGYFVDQKFIDFVPILFENFYIVRDTGYNVAYWNLHSRRLSEANGSWQCNGEPLYFFHFSGYRPGGPGISTHIPESMARLRLSNRSELRGIFETYRKLLLENAYEQTITWPYSFAKFKSGSGIPNHVRTYYRNLGSNAMALGDPFSSAQLERVASNGDEPATPDASVQLNAILNSRAWRWVSQYGRIKDRLLRVFGRNVVSH